MRTMTATSASPGFSDLLDAIERSKDKDPASGQPDHT